jgi:hypothetical protein
MSKGLLTKSRLACARLCKLRHFYEYEQGIRAVDDAEALVFGRIADKGLSAWWKAKQAGAEQDIWLEAAMVTLDGVADPFAKVKAEVMLYAYHHKWKDEPYEVLGVQVPFRAELRNPSTGRPSQTWDLGGQLDAIVRDLRTGEVKFVESKTSSEDLTPGSDYWKRLRLDSQVSIYFAGGKALGHDFAACIYDVLGKPGQRPLKATPEENRKYTAKGALYANQRDRDETPDEYKIRLLKAFVEEPDGYLARCEVVRLEAEMAAALGDVWMQGQEIREAENAERWPRNVDACSLPGRTCPFWIVCAGEASIDDPTRYRRINNPHPELPPEIAAP